LKNAIFELRTAAVATFLLVVVLCGAYPLVVWAIAQGLFPHEAGGSLVQRSGETVASELIAQRFSGARYFHPRSSAAGEAGYDAAGSSGSNLGPISKKLLDAVQERAAAYRTANGLAPEALVPADAVTASGSGLDPHISVANALLQASRVARERGRGEDEIKKLVRAHIEGRDLGVFGEPRVNVLRLNLALGRNK
jgi:K+-transporting ATPase ATPase C chain